MKFTKSLQKNRDFQLIYDCGNSYANKYLVMFIKENNSQTNRLGISVSKKVGNSVIRHRVKRLIKESYRLQEEMFNSGLDMVIIARSTAKGIGFLEIESAVLHLGRLHKVLK
jgi:ribonuclease P protein component